MGATVLSEVFSLLLLMLGLSYALSFLAQRIHQPKLIGEILAGLFVGQLFAAGWLPKPGNQAIGVVDFVGQTGLITLMFLAGTEVKRLHLKSNMRATTSLLLIGTLLPVLLVYLSAEEILPMLGGTKSNSSSLVFLGLCISVTSIPVISRIFQELEILNTPFARFVLGSAVLEDVLLWAILSFCLVDTTVERSGAAIALELLSTTAYIGAGLTLLPRIINWLYHQRASRIISTHISSWPIFIILAYVSLAYRFHVNEVFAAFLSGFAIATMLDQNQRAGIEGTITAIHTISSKMLVPIFFALIGFKLKLTGIFSGQLFLWFLFGSSLVAILSNYVALRLARLSHLSALNIAITNNARGAPGIVLATIGHQAGLVNNEFYLTLILTAIVTSQCAALWLKFVLKKKWPLLAEAA